MVGTRCLGVPFRWHAVPSLRRCERLPRLVGLLQNLEAALAGSAVSDVLIELHIRTFIAFFNFHLASLDQMLCRVVVALPPSPLTETHTLLSRRSDAIWVAGLLRGYYNDTSIA
jgi:hypothetical protein